MTIGIAATGSESLSNVLLALRIAETLGGGSIGGFAVLAVMSTDGYVQYAETQNGGSTALQINSDWRSCRHAALISSGPHRPAPLQQFLPGLDGVGLVTGHRRPHVPFAGSRLNKAVLNLMQAGAPPRTAVRKVLEAYPESDAGLMALAVDGSIGFSNSKRVKRRNDIRSAMAIRGDETIALMMNSINFSALVQEKPAETIGKLALGLQPALRNGKAVLVNMPRQCPLFYGTQDQVVVDNNTGKVAAIYSADTLVKSIKGNWPAIQAGCVVRTADGTCLGRSLHDVVGQVEKTSSSTVFAEVSPRFIVCLNS